MVSIKLRSSACSVVEMSLRDDKSLVLLHMKYEFKIVMLLLKQKTASSKWRGQPKFGNANGNVSVTGKENHTFYTMYV